MLTLMTLSVLWVLRRLHELVHDWAHAVLLLGALNWAVTWLVYRLCASDPAATRAALQRKINDLRLVYPTSGASSRAEHRSALLALFRAHRVGAARLGRIGPLLGLLRSAVGLWVFFGLLLVLWRRPELRGAPFLWIADITRRDLLLILAMTGLGVVSVLLNSRRAEVSHRAFLWYFLVDAATSSLLPAGLILYRIGYTAVGAGVLLLRALLRWLAGPVPAPPPSDPGSGGA